MAVLIAGIILSVNGTIPFLERSMPFMPVAGTSMEPELHQGDLILIDKGISASEVEVGDIIVFHVPETIQEHYHYPPVVAHRVMKIDYDQQGNRFFRTIGDNVATEEPFAIRSQDLMGTVGKEIPHLGYIMLFLQSRNGTLLVAALLIFIALFMYWDDILKTAGKAQRAALAPVIEQNEELRRTNEESSQAISQALSQLAVSVSEYGAHLQSHTASVQGMAESARQLEQSTRDLNAVLSRMKTDEDQQVMALDDKSSGECA